MKMMTLLSSVRSEHVVRHSGDIDLIVLASKRDILHTMVTTTMMVVDRKEDNAEEGEMHRASEQCSSQLASVTSETQNATAQDDSGHFRIRRMLLRVNPASRGKWESETERSR